MTPQPGQHVKCILRNGAIAEGIVEEWYNNVVQLKSLDGESLLIITHPAEDIMLIKITVLPKIDLPVVDEVTDTTETVTSQGVYMVQDELEHKFQEAYKLPSDDPTRIKTLAELRILKAEQEKKIISEKVRNHYPNSSAYDLSKRGKLVYQYPDFKKTKK